MLKILITENNIDILPNELNKAKIVPEDACRGNKGTRNIGKSEEEKKNEKISCRAKAFVKRKHHPTVRQTET